MSLFADIPKKTMYIRISVLLHELCHAMLQIYECRKCSSYEFELSYRGHGEAWQLLAAKIEEVTSSIFGIRLDLNSTLSLFIDEKLHKRPKSKSRDWERFMFEQTLVGHAMVLTPEKLPPKLCARANEMKRIDLQSLGCDSLYGNDRFKDSWRRTGSSTIHCGNSSEVGKK